MTRAFELANHLGGHPVFILFGLILGHVEVADPVSVDLDFRLFHAVFQNLVPDLREQPLNIAEVDFVVLLQQPDYVGLAPLFYEVLEVARLRVVHLQLRLDLANRVQALEFAQHNALLLIAFWGDCLGY